MTWWCSIKKKVNNKTHFLYYFLIFFGFKKTRDWYDECGTSERKRRFFFPLVLGEQEFFVFLQTRRATALCISGRNLHEIKQERRTANCSTAWRNLSQVLVCLVEAFCSSKSKKKRRGCRVSQKTLSSR